jgi:uncharacterized membrane protein YgcG
LEDGTVRNSRDDNRRRRIAVTMVAAVAAVSAFVLLGGAGLAQNAIGLHQYQYGKKVTICHKGKVTVRISLRAWLAHKRHGDSVGDCARTASKKDGKHRKSGTLETARKHGKREKGQGKGRTDGETSQAAAASSSSGSNDASGRGHKGGDKGAARGNGGGDAQDAGTGHGKGKGNGRK